MLSSAESSALLALSVPTLPNTVLVQLVGIDTGRQRAHSLFSVYREAGMTFHAIAHIDVGTDKPASLAEVLSRYVTQEQFSSAVLGPLVTEARRHFAR